MSSAQSECSNPLIFHEQKTTHLGTLTSEAWEYFISLAKCPERPLQWINLETSTIKTLDRFGLRTGYGHMYMYIYVYKMTYN